MNGADIKEEKPSPNPNEGEHIVRAQHMPLFASLLVSPLHMVQALNSLLTCLCGRSGSSLASPA